jgi:predicted dehydrogenase
MVKVDSSNGAPAEDSVTFTLRFSDGSVGTVHYFANGNRSFPKERLEVFTAGRILQLDNFRKLSAYGWPGFHSMNLWRQDKGHQAAQQAFVEAVRRGCSAPIPFEEIVEVTMTSFQIKAQASGRCCA